MIFSSEITELAGDVLQACRRAGLTIATAESCTGGLIAAALTEIAGASDTFTCAYVTYSNQAKFDMLDVPLAITEGPPGAVSAPVAIKMAEAAAARSGAGIAVAVTGIAGPGGGTTEKPVGLVYIAAKRRGQEAIVEEHRFGALGRTKVRMASVTAALNMLRQAAQQPG